MTALTLEILRETARKMRESPPPPSEIRVGSLPRFSAFLKESGQFVITEGHAHFWAGLPVNVTHLVPENMAVLEESPGVTRVIHFDKQETPK